MSVNPWNMKLLKRVYCVLFWLFYYFSIIIQMKLQYDWLILMILLILWPWSNDIPTKCALTTWWWPIMQIIEVEMTLYFSLVPIEVYNDDSESNEAWYVRSWLPFLIDGCQVSYSSDVCEIYSVDYSVALTVSDVQCKWLFSLLNAIILWKWHSIWYIIDSNHWLAVSSDSVIYIYSICLLLFIIMIWLVVILLTMMRPSLIDIETWHVKWYLRALQSLWWWKTVWLWLFDDCILWLHYSLTSLLLIYSLIETYSVFYSKYDISVLMMILGCCGCLQTQKALAWPVHLRA